MSGRHTFCPWTTILDDDPVRAIDRSKSKITRGAAGQDWRAVSSTGDRDLAADTEIECS